MVFMEDSERAASLAMRNDLEIGLHTNFSQSFDGTVNYELIRIQRKTARFLRKSKYSVLVYNPSLKNEFRFLFEAQYSEFCRLYGKPPSHIDGHQHFHLCANIILDSIIPTGARIRRNFTFGPDEKDPFNRLYRRVADNWIMRRYTITDYFFDISPISTRRMEIIADRARRCSVELMVHPERNREYSYLMGKEFSNILANTETRGYNSVST